AAGAQGAPIGRVSFIDALRWWLLETHGSTAAVGKVPRLKLWPIRPDRHHPRYLKRGPSPFKVMAAPRHNIRTETTKLH
ncbi:hypothetical protein MNBD_PLANCTO03-1212, partial [hydrothermal vent metagenome]